MSIGEIPICLFFASVEAGIIFVKIGITSSAMTAMCNPTAITWLQPKFSSFVQISFTFIALIPGGSGACFGGEKKSLIRSPNPPKFEPQATVSLLFTCPRYLRRGRRNSTRLPAIPEPKLVFVKGASARSRTLMGRSTRNCLRFDQKSSGMRMSGGSNFGTAEDGIGTAGPRPPADTLALVISGGRRLINLPGTVYLFNLD